MPLKHKTNKLFYKTDQQRVNREKLFRHPAMQILKGALARELRLQFLLTMGLLSAGMLLCILFIRESLILSLFGLLLSGIALRLIYQLIPRLNVENTQLITLLREDPKQIVWVYAVVTERLPFGLQLNSSGTMYFKLANGDEISVAMPASKLKLVSKFLNRLLPHASFGYSRNRAEWFSTNPSQLRKDKQDQ